MKSLIIGSNGQVGRALSRQLPQALKTIHDSAAVEPQVYMDITKYDTMLNVFEWYRPKVVYLAAAITNVDACENLETNVTNVRGAITVLRLCEQFEAKLVYFSSSYVFDGKSEVAYGPLDEMNPINNYGSQKQTVENQIVESKIPCVIIRTVGVFGYDPRKINFVYQIFRSLFQKKNIFVPNDQFMNPIWSNDLARIAIKLVDSGAIGTYHVAGDRCLTKSEFARKVERYFDLSGKITGVPSDDMKQKAKRPRMGCLDSYDLEELGITVPSFENGLARYLEQLSRE